jgi:hypothetical protein
VLSEIIYDAKQGGVYPEEALRDPYIKYISFTEGFLGVLPGTLIDTHFTTRGRLSRLPSFLARLAVEEPDRDLLGIGLDEQTALLVEPDGRASVVGRGAVTFLRRTAASKAAAEAGKPPRLTDLALDVLTEGYVLDLPSRAILQHPASVTPLSPLGAALPQGPLLLSGGASSAANEGEFTLQNAIGDGNAYRKGLLALGAGTKALGGALVVTRLFQPSDLDFIENRFGGALWALGQGPSWALLLDDGASASAGPGGLMPQPTQSEPAVLLLDARKATERAASPYAPQQGAALVGATLHLLRSGDTWMP